MDNSTVIWVFANTTFWAQIDSAGQPVKCDEDPTVGYANFFVELSLSEMYNRHSEMRKIKGDTEVFLFEGYPTEWKHQNVQPFLVQAYAAKDDGRLMGFQSHYDADINGGWSLLGYNFDDMKASKPPKHLYSSLPSMCEPDSK
ncbi:hypothetical protein M3Y94_00920400 [Aphelenchoides besseyi]|nr:hypothetical protein M3Y94_00920400 [Aphelenchoides besseyi]